MKKYAYLNYTPIPMYAKLATDENIELISIGQILTEDVTPELIRNHPLAPFDGVIVFDATHALQLCPYFPIGVFETKVKYNPQTKVHTYNSKLYLYNLTQRKSS